MVAVLALSPSREPSGELSVLRSVELDERVERRKG